jgi:hypothetical protein
MRNSKWAAALIAILLFACGAVVGALADRYIAMGSVTAKTSEDFRHRYVSEMQSRLKLTPAQVAQLETILDQTKAKYKAVRDGYRPQMLKIKQDQITRVESILTPAQVPAYRQLVAEHEQRAREQEQRERQEEQRRHGDHAQPAASGRQ